MSNEISYKDFVAVLIKDPKEVLETLTPEKVDMLHAASGIGGEAGEVTELVKKSVFYNKEIDRQEVVKELGDLKFYVTRLMTILDITEEEVEQVNREKLAERYEGLVYSDEAAKQRKDKEK